MTQAFKLTLMWIVAAIAALVVAVAPIMGAMAGDGQYVPIGPDGFYHARRILDTVADSSSFFQFDPLTHAPDGNLITWPWAYDYAMSLLVRLALALHLTANAMAALTHIPVVAFPLALLLVLSICRSLAVSPGLTLLAMLGTAFFPLNQALYSLGNIDHHYAEHLFVLGTLAATLAWLRAPDSRPRAIVAGVTFGLATGVHSALFALQLPLLGTFFLLWLRRAPLPRHTRAFAIALVAAQLAVALPSLPLQRGDFHYYTLSWFQPYVAACTAIAVLLLATLPRNARGFAILAGVSLVLLVPTLHQVVYASDFFTNSIAGMDDISEVRSVLVLWRSMGSFGFVASNYTWMLALLPLTMLLCAWWLWRPRDALQAHFALISLAGLALLLAQARLQYFGSFALYLPWLVALAAWRPEQPRWALAAFAGAALLMAAAWLPGITSRIFVPQILASDPHYAVTRAMYAPLAALCERAPGVVLADPYDGHYIRFHSRCPMIGNNFLVTRHDVEKVVETRALLARPAKEIATAAPAVRYLFIRSATIFFVDTSGMLVFKPGDYPDNPDYPLVRELLSADANALPPRFELVYELREAPGKRPFARLFEIEPAGTVAVRP